MNILFLSDVYFPRINGVSTSIHTLRAQLVAQGHQVQLVAPDYYSPSDDESWIVRMPSRQLFFDPEDRLMRFRHALDYFAWHSRGTFDLVHVHTPFVAHYLGLRLAQQLDVPVVETYHTFFEEYLHYYLPVLPRPLLRSVARGLSRRQCNAVDAVISPSQPMLDELRGYGVTARAAVIPTGLEEHSFAAADGAAFRQRYGIPLERPLLLYVGRVAHEKNIDFLLRMLVLVKQNYPDVLLLIAGEGPALEGLRREAELLGLQGNTQFLGYLDRHTELNHCYRAADVFVFSSVTETQGLVLLEAMAQQVPLVAVAELGAKSVLQDGVGVLVAPLDERVFAGRVIELLSDPLRRRQLGEIAGNYAQQWSARGMAEQMVEFYRNVIAVRHPIGSNPGHSRNSAPEKPLPDRCA